MNNFDAEIVRLNKILDKLDIELAMNAEALESIEMRLRLLKIELDYQTEDDIIE